MRNEGVRKDGKWSEYIWDCGDRCPFVFKFGRHLVLNLFPLPLTPAHLLSDGLPIKGCAANMTIVLITHHYNGAANHVAPLQWCC
jgi:hypothetical protein